MFEKANYSPLPASEPSEEDTKASIEAKKKVGWSTVVVAILLLVSTTITGIIGFFLGHDLQKSSNTMINDYLNTPGNINYPMEYNTTFSKEPSPETNAAWDSMFPLGVGFVKHPEISPELSGLAVFHELHCVNMLRIGYYAALNGNLADMQHVHDHNKRPDPHHLRHCFDYLRQSLMCTVDTNLEPVDFSLGGVTGWHFDRTCRDFEKVKAWAEENRAWDATVKVPEHQ